MKKLFAVLLTISAAAVADTISTPAGNSVITLPAPATYAANTPTGNTPFFNNSTDAIEGIHQGNAGYFVTDTGFFTGGVTPVATGYLGQTASPNLPAMSFSMLRSATSINVSVLYQNATTNTGTSGSTFGIYDVNTNVQTQIFGPGAIPPAVGQAATNVNTSGIATGYGFYATVCQPTHATNCFTFFSDTTKNPNVTNFGNSFVVEGPSATSHQHFALFTLASDPNTFYLAFENSISNSQFDGLGGPEGQGNYISFILKITTTGGGVGGVPEPATLSMMGIGLLGLGVAGRRMRRKA